MSSARPPAWYAPSGTPLAPLGIFIRLSAFGFIVAGLGLTLVLPIHSAFSLGEVTLPTTPLYARHNADQLRRVVARVAISGAYLILLGLAIATIQELFRRLILRPRNLGPP